MSHEEWTAWLDQWRKGYKPPRSAKDAVGVAKGLPSVLIGPVATTEILARIYGCRADLVGDVLRVRGVV